MAGERVARELLSRDEGDDEHDEGGLADPGHRAEDREKHQPPDGVWHAERRDAPRSSQPVEPRRAYLAVFGVRGIDALHDDVLSTALPNMGPNSAAGGQPNKPRLSGASFRADDGTRTHDLLHGKQTL